MAVKIRLRRMGAKKAPFYRIVVADSMLGEITEKMAVSVGKADAVRILIPVNRCETIVAGVSGINMSALVSDALLKLENICKNPR